MDISLIISGNLTGFSRFYISPKAKELISEAKFDFDNYNYLTFLSEKGKAYSISFSSNVIAVSLITRILDSFRRPGLLVVSLLLPRHYVIVSNQDRQDKGAIYQLLNKINDKFYERNFLNGMLNQNPVVLMQDYYSEILSGYTLQEDFNQKNINSSIDVTILNKRVGYITSAERDIPLYLSSPYRKNYEGYHYVFFAENAPQNIEEEPDEVVLYKVHINNNNYRLPQLVRLTDKIYRLSPSEGEFDFNQDFTYNEVLSGVAGSQIKGTVEEETIELSFRFKQEERTIHFVFEDGLEEVPFANIAPVVEYADGSSYNIASDTFTFLGKEIYEPKILKSGKTNYIIKPASSGLDIQRLKDGATCHIQVERCCTLEMSFSEPYDIPKKITIKRRSTGQSLVFDNIKERIYKILPGSLDEWDYMIESESYETVSGHFLPLGSPQHISFKTKILPQPISVRGRDAIGTSSRGTKSVSYVSEPTPKTGIRISGGKGSTIIENPVHPSKKRKIFILFFFLTAFIIAFGLIKFFGLEKGKNEMEINAPKEIKKSVVFDLLDAKGNSISQNVFLLNDTLLSFECSETDSMHYERISNNNTLKYNFIGYNPSNDSINISVIFDEIEIGKFSKAFLDIEKNENIQLNILTPEMFIYLELKEKKESDLTKEKWKQLKEKVERLKEINNKQFRDRISSMFNNLSYISETKKLNNFPDKLDQLWLTLDNLKQDEKLKDEDYQKSTNNVTVSERVKALKKILEELQNGNIPNTEDENIKRLSKEQKKVLADLRTCHENLGDDDRKKIVEKLKKKKGNSESLHQVNGVVDYFNNIFAKKEANESN